VLSVLHSALESFVLLTYVILDEAC
jgi:hypothetical protein